MFFFKYIIYTGFKECKKNNVKYLLIILNILMTH